MAHETLTDLVTRVQDVDPAMVDRTREYLLSRRDGRGGFERNARALDTFGRVGKALGIV